MPDAYYKILRSNNEAAFKDADEKKGIVTGYFSNFNNVDSDGDIIRAGAFSKTIKENGPNSTQPRIKHLFNHNPGQPLGKLLTLAEDSKGLYYESQTGTHSLGQDFIKMVQSGLITEHSIGYRPVKWTPIENSYGLDMSEVKLWEGSSLSGWGANELTPLTGMKNANKQDFINDLIKRQNALEKFCRETTATDETIELLLIESKQLTQIIFELKNQNTTKPDESTLPGNGEEVSILEKFIHTLKTA
jgi:HK97 family phage prohead protease